MARRGAQLSCKQRHFGFCSGAFSRTTPSTRKTEPSLAAIGRYHSLWESGNKELRIKHWSLCNGNNQLQQLVRWTWRASGWVTFSPVRRQYPPGNEHARQFTRLCRSLIVTYPFLLHRPVRPDRLIPVEQEHDSEWVVEIDNTGLTITPNGDAAGRSSTLVTTSACDQFARNASASPKLQFYAHLRFSRLVQAWGGATRWHPSRRLVARVAGALRRTVGKDERTIREEKYKSEGGEMADGLGQLSWTQLHRMHPGTSVELQTFFRLKAGASLSGEANSPVIPACTQTAQWRSPKHRLTGSGHARKQRICGETTHAHGLCCTHVNGQ